jgi:hypothetical protein
LGSFSLDSVEASDVVGSDGVVKNINHVFSDPLLIGLSGKIGKQNFKFLLDSGASCNFIALSALDALKLDHDLVVS